MSSSADVPAVIQQGLQNIVATDSRNAMPAHNGMTIYDAPLVAVAAADDPLFAEFKKPEIIGPDHLSPGEWLTGAKCVVSYFLPFTREIRRSNRELGLPSEEWASARIDGEAFNNVVRQYLADLVRELGGQAVVPVLDPRFKARKVVSNWSERHAAYAAGLGTFGLHRGLITAKGTAGRFGSVVTTLDLPVTVRPYTGPWDYCPWLVEKKCGLCVERCKPGAMSFEGKDKDKCRTYIDNEVLPLFKPRYGCAKCQMKVPCEHGIPKL